MKALSRESRSLIDAARDGDEPSAVDRKRVRAGLARKLAIGAAAGAVAATASHAAAGGIAGGTSAAGAASLGSAAGASAAGAAGATIGAAAAASVAPAVGGLFAAGIGAKILASVAIVGAMSVGTVGYVKHVAAERSAAEARALVVQRAPASAGSSEALRARSVAKPAAAPAEVTPEVVPGATEKAVIPSKTLNVPVPAPIAPPPGASASASAPTADLDVELALLQDVHGALRAGDAPHALHLLDEHARRFPNGALAEESEAARVFALCQMSRTDEARDLASRFLREHPRSLLAPRVSRACDAEPSTF